MRHLSCGLWILAFVASLAASPRAQDAPPGHEPEREESNTFTGFAGTVARGDTSPAAGAYVEIRPLEFGAVRPEDFDGPPTRWQWTAQDGSFAFEDLEDRLWLITAVVWEGARDDVEARGLARRHSDGEALDGVGVSHLVDRVRPLPWRTAINTLSTTRIGLAVEPAGADVETFHGRLSGAFEPELFAYQASYSPPPATRQFPASMIQSGPDISSAVRIDGTFELPLLGSDRGIDLLVEARSLDATGSDHEGFVWHGALARQDGHAAGEEFEIELAARQHVLVRIRDIPALPSSDEHAMMRDRVKLRVWSENGSSKGPVEPWRSGEALDVDIWLFPGSYRIQASLLEDFSHNTPLEIEEVGDTIELELSLAP